MTFLYLETIFLERYLSQYFVKFLTIWRCFAGQQLFQMPDGKLHILNAPQGTQQVVTTQGGRLAVVQKAPAIVRAIQTGAGQQVQVAQSPQGDAAKTTAAAATAATATTPGTVQAKTQQTVVIRPGGQVVQKLGPGQQLITGGQLVVNNNQVKIKSMYLLLIVIPRF